MPCASTARESACLQRAMRRIAELTLRAMHAQVGGSTAAFLALGRFVFLP